MPDDFDNDELNRLLHFGTEIEHKFAVGRAMDIGTTIVQNILRSAIHIRQKTITGALKNALVGIENTTYAILNSQHDHPRYYEQLRTLLRQIQSLKAFM